MPKYNHKAIEKKWQKYWKDEAVFAATTGSKKPKKYILVEFPYPSGVGLHVGHPRSYVAADVTARFLRASGYNVMYPFGFDAFGLPAENYAIKTGIQPQISTDKNIKNIRRQAMAWGLSFDWDREVITTDPDYYKWTQWLFLQFYKAGLAYEAVAPINWCPKDKTALANEEVIDGKCERCGTVVEKKNLRQWYLKITDYAQKLLNGLKTLGWPEPIKLQQENWIGRSEGAEISFPISTAASRRPVPKSTGSAEANVEDLESVKIFTTRPDTIFGATYIVLAPEHPLAEFMKDSISNWAAVENYITEAKNKTDVQRQTLQKEKTGVELKGLDALNPATNERIPVWIADYVLPSYGTGAIMGVPAHDARDSEFADRFSLPIKIVISEDGTLVNSGPLNGLDSTAAKKEAIKKFGKSTVQYRMRDWVFSRQRYWGEPIPLIHCDQCGIVPVPEKDLPVLLPKVKKYEPTGTGESPLAGIASWVNVKCPQCKGSAKRETNTMPQWAGSSWYFLRYTDPHNSKKFADPKALAYWMPVDMYFGGTEHTTLHLLYSRFWNLFLHDQGLVPVKEPYAMRQPHGIILGPDGEKMSKSKGNTVDPDDTVQAFGADAFRIFVLFLGPHEQVVSWNDQGAIGVRRFLERVWNFSQANLKNTNSTKLPKGSGKILNSTKIKDSEKALFELHKLIKKISEDIQSVKFNTAVSAFMEFINNIGTEQVSKKFLAEMLVVLSPFAPHMAEELWHQLGHSASISKEPWPTFDASKLVQNSGVMVIQVNGKVRGNIELPKNADQKIVEAAARELPTVSAQLDGKQIRKVIFIQGRLINFVV